MSEKETLTPRECEVLEYLGKGYENEEIAKVLHISTHTAKFHVASILRKLNVRKRGDVSFICGLKIMFKAFAEGKATIETPFEEQLPYLIENHLPTPKTFR